LTQLDLTPIPLVDNHCHGIYSDQSIADIPSWRRHFTEAKDAGMQQTHVATTLFYRRLIRAMAVLFACEPKEEVILAARQAIDGNVLIQRCLQDAHFEALCIDKGYPPPSQVVADAALSTLANCRVAPMLRVELVMQELIAELSTFDEVVEKLQARLQDVRAQGYVALKSIVAYRTGLAIQTWDKEEVTAAFAAARQEVQQQGSVRLGYKPLLDTLLHVVFKEAARQELPIQFHTGYGDTDADMLLANPLNLRAVFEQEQYRAMPIVLLHECYPYTRQGAYLAAVYENAYLDLSYGIPFLGYSEMLEFTRAAFDVAPYSKLLYSSDGVGMPELHWLSAHNGRRIIGQVLWERVSNGELDIADAEQAGSAVLRDNALKLYRL
jgi:predicted TIM-barrel fold metal-dependent hydrolase